MALSLPPLPYEPDALAPRISAETLEHHYGRHHRGYVETANRLLAGKDAGGTQINDILLDANGPLANAAAQAWNHAFYWQCMTPRPGRPGDRLAAALESAFGSLPAFEQAFKAEARQLFGSGWVWLVCNAEGELGVVATPNAGLRVHEDRLHPLLVCDVWEHAYYIDYRGDRGAYVEAFWELINWSFVGARLQAAPAVSRWRRAGAGDVSLSHVQGGP